MLFKKMDCLSCASKWAMNSGIQTATQWRILGRKVIPSTMHANLKRYRNIDNKYFLRGGYYESNSCTCK